MQVPLLHRSTQMALLKKQIRRKAKELRQRKRRAQRRLEVMCRIRDHLLERMRQSIDLRQKDAALEKREQTRRAVSGMLAMHKHWLRNWSRALRLQSRLIRQQEQLKKRLQRRLNLLRKQLKKRRHPQRLVDKCFRRLAQAIKKWQKTTDYHQFIEGQEQIWEAEADEVRKYLSAIRGKRPRKYRRIRVSVDNDIGDFNEFWKSEVLPKYRKVKKRRITKEPEIEELELEYKPYKIRKPIKKTHKKKKPKANPLYFSIDDLIIQQNLKRKQKGTQKPDPTRPSFDELKLLVRELTKFDKPKKAKKRDQKNVLYMSEKVIRKQRKNLKRKMLTMSDISIFTESQEHKQPISKKARKSLPLKFRKLFKLDFPLQPKVLKDRVLTSKKARKYKKKFRKQKTSYVDLVIRDELRALFDENKKIKKRRQHISNPKKTVATALEVERDKKTKYVRKQSLHIDNADKAGKTGKARKVGKAGKVKPEKQSSFGEQRNLVSLLFEDLSAIIKHRRRRKKSSRDGKVIDDSTSSTIISKEVLYDPKTRPSDATDVMVKRLKKIPKLREDKSETQVYADSDSIASLSESLKKIINASRPRKSIRKSIHGPLVPPKQLRIAPPKEKVDSHYQTLKKDIMYIRANDSDAARSKKFRRLSTRRSLSVPLMSSQKQRLLLKKSVSDTFITKSRPPFGKIIGEDLQDMGRPMDKSIPQAGDQLGLQIDENLNKTVAPRRDSIGYSTPTFPSKEKLRQLQEYNYEGLPEDFHRFFDNAHDTYNYERIVKSPEDEYGTEARDSRRQKDLKEYTPGRFLIKDLESDDKHKPLQTFLKDIIENNKFVEFGADVKGLMLVVGKHHMWNSLQLLHDDLMQSGFSRGEVKQMLSAKYMEYLSDIASGLQFAKIEAPRDIFLNFVETDPAKPKQMSQVDRLIAKNYWNKQRLSTRLIPFGMRGLKGTRSASPHSRRLSQDTRMDSAMYKKLMEQEMNAERLERENRKRRLFPTFSRIFGSFESAVSISSVNMAPDEEQDLRDSEMRYSLQNLNTVMNDHKLMFKAMDRKRLTAQLVQKKMEGQLKEMRSTTQFWRPKGKPTTFTLKKRKRGLRPIEALYYTPRKTSRMQKITEDSCSECECQEEKLADSMVLQKCPRCGVKVPVPAPTPPFYISPSSSSEILSSGSIEACAKNELVANTLADLCPRCGFVHGKNDPCSQLPQNRRKNSLLKRIQDSVRTAPQCTTFCSPGGILKKPRSFDP